MERVLEPYLHGSSGGEKVQVNVAGRNIRVLERTEPIPGDDVYLTLDIHLQGRNQLLR